MDEYYMKMALAQARRGLGRVSPNPLVGAVVVKRGVVVGRGFHQRAGTPHAEIYALAEAGEKARGADLYVNLEPCCHYGRTPPCVEAIIEGGVKRVVIGMVDPNPLVSGGGIARLKAAGIETRVGVLGSKCQKLNEAYCKFITRKIPFVILKVASSLDGKIATKRGDSRGLSSSSALDFVHRLRNQVDAILVGIGTVEADDPLLTTRLKGAKGKDPIRVVVDSTLRISLGARVLNPHSPAGTIVATTSRAPQRKRRELEAKGVEIITVDSAGGKVALKKLMRLLGKRGITSVLIEGGTGIITSAIREGVVDKLIFIFAPKIVGGQAACGITAGEGVEYMRQALKVRDVEVKRCGEDIVVEGYITKPNEGYGIQGEILK